MTRTRLGCRLGTLLGSPRWIVSIFIELMSGEGDDRRNDLVDSRSLLIQLSK